MFLLPRILPGLSPGAAAFGFCCRGALTLLLYGRFGLFHASAINLTF